MSTVKVDTETHRALRELAAALGLNMTAVLKQAVRRMQKEQFWQGVREDFARLRQDPKAWAGYLAEAEALQGSFDELSDETAEWAALYPELDLKRKTKRSRR
jgi:hypothetical protein